MCCNVSSGAVVKRGKGACICLCERVGVKEGMGGERAGAVVLAHVCVWRAGVDTDTAAPLSSSISSQDV